MYGIKEENGVKYLIQNKETQNAVGLNSSPAFSEEKNGKCFHDIDLSKTTLNKVFEENLASYKSNKLIQALMPLPKKGHDSLFIIDDKQARDVIYYAIALSSPCLPTIAPMWGLNEDKFKNDLFRSNIGSFVITDVDNTQKMVSLAKLAAYSPSKVIFMGDPLLPVPKHAPIKSINPRFKITQELRDEEQWRRLGARELKEYMRCQ